MTVALEGDAKERHIGDLVVDFVTNPDNMSDANRDWCNLHLTLCKICRQEKAEYEDQQRSAQ
jgi:hypothetical protein